MNKLPDKLDDYNEARKQGFLKVKALKDKGVNVVGVFCTHILLLNLYMQRVQSIGLCGMSEETIPDAKPIFPKKPMSPDKIQLWLCCLRKMSLLLFF